MSYKDIARHLHEKISNFFMAEPNGNSNIRTEEKDYVIGMRDQMDIR